MGILLFQLVEIIRKVYKKKYDIMYTYLHIYICCPEILQLKLKFPVKLKDKYTNTVCAVLIISVVFF